MASRPSTFLRAAHTLLACAILSLVACGTQASAADDGDETTPHQTPDAAIGDTTTSDSTASDDVGSGPETTDAITVDGVAVDAERDAELCSGQGCRCEDNPGCDSGYCLQDGQGGRYCADACSRSCATLLYRCLEFVADDTPDSTPPFLCVLKEYPYCGACEGDFDCAGFGVCTPLRDGSFCTPYCGVDDPCPTGSECTTLGGPGDAPVCVPTLLHCAE